jgi:serine/threonine-protein kinase RsbW
MSGTTLQLPDLVRQDDLRTEASAVLTIPADKHYVAVARTAALHVAGIMGLPISRTTDLRLAVDEACALFLDNGRGPGEPAETGRLTVVFTPLADALQVTVSGAAPRRRVFDDELGWTLLRALCEGEVRWEQDGTAARLTLTEPLPARLG